MTRFQLENETVIDSRSGLMWTRDASLLDFPLSWKEALNAVKNLNTSNLYGHHDWKVPNRKELFTLMSHETINPCLPIGHPFANIFAGYYWTSTTCDRLPNQAWYIHLGGARVFKGMKHGSYMVWPVRTVKNQYKRRLFQTGQRTCYNEKGDIIRCHGTGQDGERQSGLAFPSNRFVEKTQVIYDKATSLTWLQNANVYTDTMDWDSAFDVISEMNNKRRYGHDDWRVPNIFELESLTDMGRHSPALPFNHFFHDVQDFYWSSTTSMFDMNYAWVLYLVDGAIGVGHKPLSEFYLWPVRGDEITIIR